MNAAVLRSSSRRPKLAALYFKEVTSLRRLSPLCRSIHNPVIYTHSTLLRKQKKTASRNASNIEAFCSPPARQSRPLFAGLASAFTVVGSARIVFFSALLRKCDLRLVVVRRKTEEFEPKILSTAETANPYHFFDKTRPIFEIVSQKSLPFYADKRVVSFAVGFLSYSLSLAIQ
jgi:hypothetical protein